MVFNTTILPLPSNSTKSILLLVLLCDTPVEPVKEIYGTYHTIFSKLFENSLNLIESETSSINTNTNTTKEEEEEEEKKSIFTLTIESYDVVSSLFPSTERIKESDCVLITGSAASAHLPLPWITNLITFVSTLLTIKSTLKLIGICFGHQILARSFGSKVILNELGWEVGVRKINLTKRGKEIFGSDELAIHQVHRDIVPTLPVGFECLGSTSICDIHGMVKFIDSDSNSTGGKFDPTKIQVITLQGHPEFSSDIVTKIVNVRNEGGVFTNEEAEMNRKFAKERDEGIRIGKILLSILGV